MKKKKKDVWFYLESPSQTESKFGELFWNCEQLISVYVTRNFYVLITGNLKVRTTNWRKNNLHMIKGEQEDSISISQSLRVD